MKTLFLDAWPLLLSGIAITMYMRIDQIMIKEMLGNEPVGIYAIAVRISEIWSIIPVILMSSLFPSIIEAKKQNEELFKSRMQELFSILAFVSLCISVLVTISSDLIISFLFGEQYSEAATVLRIHVWSSIFVFLGVAASRWYIIENLQRISLYRTVVGAGVNILLNLVLIPYYGVVGAAIATVISYAIAAYLLDFSSSKTAVIFNAKTKALFIVPIYCINFFRRTN